MKQEKKSRNRIMRATFAGSAVLIPLVGLTAVAVNPAAAKPAAITCSKVSGTVNLTANTSSLNLKTCSGNTGGSGKSDGTASTSTATDKINWKAAGDKSTTIGGITVSYTVGCPTTGPHGYSLIADEAETGSVTADNTGSTVVGAAMSADICVYATATSGDYTLSNAPGTEFVIAA